MNKLSLKWQSLIERSLPWLVLGILAIFTYAKFVVAPYLGFGFLNGKITEVFIPTPNNSIQAGDRVIQVDQLQVSEFLENMHLTIFNGKNFGDEVSLVLDRGGEITNIDWKIPGPNQIQLLQRFNGIWWLAYIFWMAGAVTLLALWETIKITIWRWINECFPPAHRTNRPVVVGPYP